MKQNWILVAAIVTVLAIPFGIATFQDATADSAEDRYRKALASGDELSAMRALDDMSSDKAAALRAEAPEDDDVVEWERDEPLDLGFIDAFLHPSEPGTRGSLAASAAFERPLAPLALDLDEDLEDVSIEFHLYATGEVEDAVAAVGFSFESDVRVARKLADKYGDPARAVSGGARSWTSEATRTKTILFDGDADSYEPMRIVVARFGSLDTLLDLVSEDAVLGQTAQALDGTYGSALDVDDEPELVFLAPAASAEPLVEVSLTIDDDEGAVSRLSLTIDLSLDGKAAGLARAGLERRFGAATAEPIGDMTELRFAKHPGLLVYQYKNRVVLERSIETD